MVSRTLQQTLQDLENRKQELVAQLVPHKLHVRRSIFAVIRAGLASELHALLHAGLFDVGERDYNGCTPLHIAAHEGRQDMVKVLISNGADPFATDEIGRTPRDLAVENRHSNLAGGLLIAMKQRFKRQQEQMMDQASGGGGSSTSTQPSPALVTMTPEAAIAAEWVAGGMSGIMHRMLPVDLLPAAVAAVAAAGVGGSSVEMSASPATEILFPIEEEEDKVMFSQYSTISDNVSLVVCMVGLPGRGKSFISKRISRYLNWKGVPCRVFNAGNYRRLLLGVNETAHANFFDPDNKVAKEQREHMAQLASEDLVNFIASNPVCVGILDATNTTVERRCHLIHFFNEMQRDVLKKPVRVMFIESVCTDERIITENILRAKCGNDDFKNCSDTAAVVAEFRERIKQYERVYEPLSVCEGVSFIKMENVKQHVVMNRITGGLASRIVFFLLNLHPVAFPIFVVTNGETEGNRDGVYGGSGLLTEKGKQAALALKDFVADRCDAYTDRKFVVLHGTNPYVMETIAPLKELAEERQHVLELIETRCLDDINFGRMNGDSVRDSVEKHPKRTTILYAPPTMSTSAIQDDRIRHVAADENPILNYCVQFPNGESCRQVNVRLESALLSIMRAGCSVLVVAPPIPAQGVVAFFTDVRPELSPCISIPRHQVVELNKGEVQLHQLFSEKET
jgi:broad specificity phosphatase PhoE